MRRLLYWTADRYPYVKRISWYQARNETNSDLHHNNIGLYYLNLDPKPSAIRLKSILTDLL